MFLKRRLAALAPAMAALAVGAPVALASTASTANIPATDPVITGPSCPDGYAGPTNPATGCPPSLMSYTVRYAGQPSYRCPVTSSPPLAVSGLGAAGVPGAGAGSVGRVLDRCSGVATAN
jgi:hypothetical protein